MNVYLAGKVDDQSGSWRNAILGRGDQVLLRAEHVPPGGSRYLETPRWVMREGSPGVLGQANEEEPEPWEWPIRTRCVLGEHHYCGPYRQIVDLPNKWSGYFHGTEAAGQHGQMDCEEYREAVVRHVRQAIRVADLVFAYINDPEAHGTLAEVGYAVACGKFVALVVNAEKVFSEDEFWFVGEMCDRYSIISDYDLRHDEEDHLVVDHLKDAIVAFAARSNRATDARSHAPPPLPARPTLDACRIFESFQDISRWTSDPRVRNEAVRMLRLMSELGGR